MKFNLCPVCGTLYPATVYFIRNYFRIIQLTVHLQEAADLLLKSEMKAAVRESLIKLETLVKRRSRLKDHMGTDLMAKAFSFEFDSTKRLLLTKPKIAVNQLSTNSQRNEQEGVKFMSMGLMQGVRNVYLHTEGSRKLFYSLQILTSVDFLIKQVTGWESVASEADSKMIGGAENRTNKLDRMSRTKQIKRRS